MGNWLKKLEQWAGGGAWQSKEKPYLSLADHSGSAGRSDHAIQFLRQCEED